MSTKEISYPFTLTTAELSYLLSLIGTEQIIGLNNRPFLPEQPEQQADLWNTGRMQLVKNGWLVLTTGSEGHYQINHTLLQIAITITQPQYIIIARLDRPQKPTQGTRYYCAAQWIVELNEIEGGYSFAVLDSTAVWQARMCHQLQLPHKPHRLSDTLSMSIDTFTQLKTTKIAPTNIDNDNKQLVQQLIKTISETPHRATMMQIEVGVEHENAHNVFGLLWNSNDLWQINQAESCLTIHRTTADTVFRQMGAKIEHVMLKRPPAK